MWYMDNWPKQTFFWGHHFCWLCNCAAIKEIPDYEGIIPIVFRWAQELLGYYFSIVHQSNKIMTDVDALNGRFRNLILQYCIITSILCSTGKQQRPKAYEE